MFTLAFAYRPPRLHTCDVLHALDNATPSDPQIASKYISANGAQKKVPQK